MGISRRYFLQSTGALAAYCGLVPGAAWGLAPEANTLFSDPAPVRRGKTLVVIFLRGGVDGLNLVVPFGDPAYSKLRPSIGIAQPGQDAGALDLDGFFGLHPRMSALTPWFKSGDAVAVHAAGYANNTRSHFEEQDVWETGVIGNTMHSDGWLNRHLATSQGWGPVRAVSIGDSLPRILRGEATAYAIRGIEDLTFPQTAGQGAKIARALERAYDRTGKDSSTSAADLVAKSGSETLEGLRALNGVLESTPASEVAYPRNGLGNKLSQVARLIKADVGLEIVELDYGGWDTHQNQGRGAGGAFGNLAGGLAAAVAAFCEDLGDRLADTLILTLSDFGRTAAENGTGGTDHGWGNAMLALGAGVSRRGRDPVVGSWPGLGAEQLHQGRDLQHTTDFRDVLCEVVSTHLGNEEWRTVVPGHEAKAVGLLRKRSRV